MDGQQATHSPKSSADDALALRKMADSLWHERSNTPVTHNTLPQDTEHLLHELQVHQIELEMQNEALRCSRQDLALSNARYFALYDQAPVGYCSLSESGLILTANLTAAALLEVPRESLISQTLTHFILPADQDIFYLMRQQLASSGLPQLGEVRMVKAGGAPFWAQLKTSHIHVEEGQVLHTLMLSDITERKKIGQAAHAAEQAAHAANQAKSQFLSTMSHEIRTPMNGVIGMIDILEQTNLQPGQRRMLTTIAQSSQSLLQILNDILDYSKIEANKLAIENIPTHLPEVVEDVRQLMQITAKLKSIALSVELAPDLPEWLYSDPTRLRQVLLNLVGNALKFTVGTPQQPGRVALQVAPCRLADGQRGVHLRVVDNGIGMTPEQVPQLFQPFVQADAGTARQFGGTGLGLSISQQLVTLMGGNISVESRFGQGSVFTVELPMQEVPVDRLPQRVDATSSSKALDHEPALGHGELILLAEDNETNRDVLVEQLHLLGYAAEVAEDGAQALNKWRNGRYALLLTDCHMPKMDGFELTNAIRAEEPAGTRLPIIAVTANALQGQALLCLAAGMDDYLSKPLRLRELGPMLVKWLPKVPDNNTRSAPHTAAPAAQDSPPPTWDAKTLTRLMGVNPVLHQHLLEKFLINANRQVASLTAAHEGGDIQTMTSVAHTLKSASRTVGAMALGELCQQLETVGQTSDRPRAQVLMPRLAEQFTQAQQLIQAHLAAARKEQA